MSGWDDTEHVLHRFRLTDDDRLLAGGRSDDAPAGVAALLAALREPGRAEELTRADELLAQMTEALGAGVTINAGVTDEAADVAGRPMLRLVTGKIAAIAAVTLFSAGAAAAATGTLPDPIQQRVANTFAHVGIHLEQPAGKPTPSTTTSASPTSAPTTPPTTPTTPVTSSPAAVAATLPASIVPAGPDAAGAAASGLCTAYFVGEQNGNRLGSTAMQRLADAAAAQELTIDAFCSQVTVTTVPAGNNPGGQPGKPDEPGNSGSTPAVTAPGQSTDHGQPATPGKPADPGNSGSRPAATAPAAPADQGKPADPGSGRGNAATTNPSITAPASTPTVSPQSSSGAHNKP